MNHFGSRVVDCARLLIGPFYSAVHTLPKIASAPSYYPEYARKPWLRRYAELLWERLATGSTNLFYNAYGEDVCNNHAGGHTYRSEHFGARSLRAIIASLSTVLAYFATS